MMGPRGWPPGGGGGWPQVVGGSYVGRPQGWIGGLEWGEAQWGGHQREGGGRGGKGGL